MKKLLAAILAILLCALCASARQPSRGYRGFFELGTESHHENNLFFNSYKGYLNISTSHGYQFNPHLFIGAGIAAFNDFAPVFVQARTDWKFGIFTPYADMRAGYSIAEGGGVYICPSIGYRFNWGRKVGINVSLGITLQGRANDYYGITDGADGYWNLEYLYTRHDIESYFSFRLGIDF